MFGIVMQKNYTGVDPKKAGGNKAGDNKAGGNGNFEVGKRGPRFSGKLGPKHE